jgi:hypothetical protein
MLDSLLSRAKATPNMRVRVEMSIGVRVEMRVRNIFMMLADIARVHPKFCLDRSGASGGVAALCVWWMQT